MLSTMIRAGGSVGRQLIRSAEVAPVATVRAISKSSEVNSDYMTMRDNNQSPKVSRDYQSKMQIRLKKVSR